MQQAEQLSRFAGTRRRRAFEQCQYSPPLIVVKRAR